MKKWGIIFVGICLLLVTFKPSDGKAETEIPEVIINELAWAGSSASSSDEWIELKNTTTDNIPIADWQITKYTSSGNTTLMLTIPGDLDPDPDIVLIPIIPPQGYFLISHYSSDNPDGADNPLSVLNIVSDYVAGTAVVLADSNLQIGLYDGPWNDGRLPLDLAGNKGSASSFCPGSGSKNNLHISTERNTIYGAGDSSNSWHSANDAINLDPGKDLGTPGANNSTPPPPAPTIDHIVPPDPAPATLDTNFVLEEIVGEHFSATENLQVKLEKGDDTIPALEWQRIDFPPFTTLQQVHFHISPDAETGKWDLVVTNLDQPDNPAILINAVEILEPEEEPVNPTYSNDIKLSELYPHPTTGGEEFIELYNSGDNSANLKGWKLDDQSPGGSAEYTIPTDIIIFPGQYLIFPKSQTHLYLNDTGDFARLLQPNGNLLDSTPNYGTATTGYSYSKINSNWQWSKRVTPNAANIYESTATEEEDTSPTDPDPNSLQPNEVTIKLEADEVAANSVMLIWKINLPGALGDIKIYQSDKKDKLGVVVGQTSPQQTEYPVKNLTAKTNYFFTLVGSYNASDISSNQIEITTTGATSTSNGSKGTQKQIIITEILPNPNAGDNEFIELYNSTDQDIDIAGWKLQDASGKTYIINAFDLSELFELNIADTEEEMEDASAVTLESGQYFLLEYPITHIRLNNSGGEEVQLLDGEDNLIDEIDYAGSAKQGYAYVLAPNSQWFWSNETTPGEENDISFASMDEDSSAYLVDSGHHFRWMVILWISGLISAIILSYIRKYGYENLYHQ